jgi:diguanylate cyclase (GGDEF)-like protein/PAS domain S-box-containing protein
MRAEPVDGGSMRSSEVVTGAVTGAVQWQALLDSTTTPMALRDPQGECLHVNEALCGLLGYDREMLLHGGLSALDYLRTDLETDAEVVEALAGSSGASSIERRLVHADGRVIWVREHTSIFGVPGGRHGVLLSQFEEIDDPRETATLWCQAFANAPIGMTLMNLKGYWTAVNDAWCEMLGYSRDEALSMCYSDVTYADDLESSTAAFDDLVEGRVSSVSMKKRYRHKDGHPLWALVRTSVIPGADDRPTYLVSHCEELSERCMTDAHLAHLALHDPLTGLANRALFADRLEHELAELQRAGGVVVVLVADLDELKPVNDRHGHAAGDRLLVTAADELLNAVSAGDTVARIGGDEFAVVSRVADDAAAEALRDRIERRLQTERVTFGCRLRLSASVGFAITADPGAEPDELVHRADRDMYRRKNNYRARQSPAAGS